MKKRNLLWLIAALLYLAFTIISHEWVSDLYSQLVKHFGKTTIENFLHNGSLATVALVIVGCPFLLKQRGSFDVHRLILWGTISFCVVLADQLLIVTNIERIHYPQYAILAVFFRVAFEDGFFALFLATLGGAVDELLQFIWNPQYTKYLDFNDVVLNVLGAVIGIAAFLSLFPGIQQGVTRFRRIKLSIYAVTSALLGLAGIVAWTGRIVSYVVPGDGYRVVTQAGGKIVFVLSFMKHPDFWTVSEFGREYHILSPLEGLNTVLFLLILFGYILAKSSSHTMDTKEDNQ
ncbi:MAG: hypothetical protein JRJ65_14010 [Deltaproteobacteria bacterium]|nr:hypothetical protein [Deltaproteobacteria bacterium]